MRTTTRIKKRSSASAMAATAARETPDGIFSPWSRYLYTVLSSRFARRAKGWLGRRACIGARVRFAGNRFTCCAPGREKDGKCARRTNFQLRMRRRLGRERPTERLANRRSHVECKVGLWKVHISGHNPRRRPSAVAHATQGKMSPEDMGSRELNGLRVSPKSR